MPAPFEGVRDALLRAGIAPRHAARYLTELREHFADRSAHERSAGYGDEEAAARARAFLGTDAELAQAMIDKGEFRSLAARAPWLVFLLAPSFALVAIFLPATMLIGFLFGFDPILSRVVHGLHPVQTVPSWARGLLQGTAFTMTFMVPLLFQALLVLIAARQRMGWVWPLLGIAAIAVFGIQMRTWPPTPQLPAGGIGLTAMLIPMRIALGEAYNGFSWGMPTYWAQLALSLLPIAWLCFLRRTTLSNRPS